MPKKGKKKGKSGSGKVYKGIIRQERKIAQGEVRKAKRKIKKKGKWTVAAGIFGHHAGYDSKRGLFFDKGNLHDMSRRMVQPPAQVQAIPASSSHLFRVRYDRKPLKNGLKVSGIQKIGTIGTVGGGSAAAFVIGGAQVSSFYVSPDAIGGQMALDARNYTFFSFKRIRLITIMNAPSTDSYGVGMAYVPDPQIGAYQTVTYDTIQQNKDILTFTRKQMGPVIFDFTELRSAQFKKYQTESDTTSDMSKRASYQGIVYGFYNASDAATNTTYGDVLMEFELMLFNRAPDYGFSLQMRSPDLVGMVAKVVADYCDRAVKDAEQKERDMMRKEGGCDEKSIVIFNKDPAWRTNVLNKIIGRYEGQMREMLAFSRIGMPPRVGTGTGNLPTTTISDPADPTHKMFVSASQQAGVFISGTVTGDPVPINIANVGGSAVGGSTLPVDYGGSGLGMSVDVSAINGAGTAGTAGYMPSQQFVDIGGGTINAVTGLSASGPVTSISASIRDSAQPRYATVSTSSSLQTVVSATECKQFDDKYAQLLKIAAEEMKVKAGDDEAAKVVEKFIDKKGLTYAAPEKIEVAMTPRVFDEFREWVKVKFRTEKPPVPAGK